MAVGLPGTDQTIDFDHLPPDFAEPPLRWPDVNALDLDRIGLDYYAPYDLLSISFAGHPVPAVNVPLDPSDGNVGYAEARVGIAGGEVTGIEITGFRSEVSSLHPLWADLPNLTGADRRRALLDLIKVVSSMPVYDGPPNP